MGRLDGGIFCPGEGEEVWGVKMGYVEERIWKGHLPCDVDAFAKSPASHSQPDKTFLYAGRLSKEKGIEVLCQAYELYRRDCRAPPPPVIAGGGPLRPQGYSPRGVVWERYLVPP